MNKLDVVKTWILSGFLVAGSTLLVACSGSNGGTTTGNPLVADTSASGAVAGAVGGALSGSSGGGVITQDVMVNKALSGISLKNNDVSTQSVSCPTYASTGSYCATSGSSLWLTYDVCKFPASADVWTGVQSLTMSTGTAACGTFPNPGANESLYRQYVSSSGGTTPSTLLLEKSAGDMYVDNHTANLANFDSDNLTTIENSGYGVKVSFNGSGARSAVTLGQRVSIAGSYDHSIYGSFSVTETAGASSRTLSGSVSVYHNLLKIVGTSVFSGLVHDDMCCLPVSGSIVTTFQAGTNVSPTAAGSLYLNKSETLTFTGCGTGTLQAYDGSVKDVSLNKCF